MKKYLNLILTLSTAVFMICGCDFGMARYQNKKYGFSLLLPKGWRQEEGAFKTIILVKAPEQGVRFNTNINLTIGDFSETQAHLGRKVRLTEFYEMNKAQLMEVLPGVKYNVMESNVSAGGHKGMLLTFSDNVDGLKLRFIIAAWVIKDCGYTITCTTEVENESKYLPIFKKVIQSLRVK